jgi:predicted ATPase
LNVPDIAQASFAKTPRRPPLAARQLGVSGMPGAAPLVGRARELVLLERHLAGQDPPLLVLAGEPGIGKSRLLQELAAGTLGHGFRVLAGDCQRQGGQTPYSPLLEAVQHVLQDLRPSELGRALQGCAWLVRLLPELAAGPIEPLPDWMLPPEQERRLMVEAIKRLLSNVAGPRGVLLDNLQWAEADALDLLVMLTHCAPALVLRIVGAYRDSEVQAGDLLFHTLGDLAQAGLVLQHHLGPLAPAEAAALLADVDPALQARLLDRAGGVPFFLVNWAQMLQERAAWDGDVAGAVDAVPWTVALSVQQRLAALQDVSREVLQVAAVVGRAVLRPLLAQVVGRPQPELLRALEEVCRVRLLEEAGENQYHFAHDVIREVVEQSLSTARRTLLHRRVAQALAAGSREPPIEQIAYHYAHTEDHVAAAEWLEYAGDRAAATLAHTTALEHYQAARDRAAGAGLDPAVRARLAGKMAELRAARLELTE